MIALTTSYHAVCNWRAKKFYDKYHIVRNVIHGRIT